MKPAIGDRVTWSTDWLGCQRTHTGEVVAIVEPGEDARKKVPRGVPWSRVRARPIVRAAGRVRALVAVDAEDGVRRFYAPEVGRLEPVRPARAG